MLRSSEIKPLFVDLSHSDKSFFSTHFSSDRIWTTRNFTRKIFSSNSVLLSYFPPNLKTFISLEMIAYVTFQLWNRTSPELQKLSFPVKWSHMENANVTFQLCNRTSPGIQKLSFPVKWSHMEDTNCARKKMSPYVVKNLFKPTPRPYSRKTNFPRIGEGRLQKFFHSIGWHFFSDFFLSPTGWSFLSLSRGWSIMRGSSFLSL